MEDNKIVVHTHDIAKIVAKARADVLAELEEMICSECAETRHENPSRFIHKACFTIQEALEQLGESNG
jgi:hypothetical protein